MTCVSRPELDDLSLLTYVDGEATPEVVAHIRRCSHCRERARRLANEQGRLRRLLYRVECPSTLELGEYHMGMLPDIQRQAVEQHLAQCPYCRREVAELQGYLADLEPTLAPDPLQQVVGRVREVVARLVSGGSPGQPVLYPAFASVRGGEQEPLVYEAGEVQVVLEIHADADRPDRWAVLGLVIGLDLPREQEAQLWMAGQRLAAVPVDDLGNFSLSDIAPGSYELTLSGPQVEIHIQDLEIPPGFETRQESN